MGDEIRYVVEFLWAIVRNWVVLIGSAIMALLGVAEKVMGREVHLRLYIRILLLLLFVSIYISWKDAKRQSELVGSPPQKFDVADYEGRANLNETKKDLVAANTEIQTLKGAKAITDAELKQTRSDLAKAEEKITQQDDKLKELTSDLAEAKRQADQVKEKQRPRVITPEQWDKFKAEIADKPAPRLLGAEASKPEIAISHFGDDEAYKFALEIRALLIECGFPTSDVPYENKGLRLDIEDQRLGTVSSRPTGILLSLRDQKYQSPWSSRIKRALE
jgi:hypothetical protein